MTTSGGGRCFFKRKMFRFVRYVIFRQLLCISKWKHTHEHNKWICFLPIISVHIKYDFCEAHHKIWIELDENLHNLGIVFKIFSLKTRKSTNKKKILNMFIIHLKENVPLLQTAYEYFNCNIWCKFYFRSHFQCAVFLRFLHLVSKLK